MFAWRRRLRQPARRAQAHAPRSAREQEAAGDRPSTGRHQRHLAVRYLACPTRAAELEDRLGEEAEAVQTTSGELAAPGVERQLAAQANAARSDEGAALAALAEAEGLDPGQREPAEAVVELERVDVAGPDIGACPERLGGVACRHRRQILRLVPDRPRPDRAPDRVDADRRGGGIPGGVPPWHDDGRPPPDRGTAALEAPPPPDPPRAPGPFQPERA